MAPQSYYSIATVTSSELITPNGTSALGEAGDFAPLRQFLDQATSNNNEKAATGDGRSRKRRKLDHKPEEADLRDRGKYIPISQYTVDLYFADPAAPNLLDTGQVKTESDFRDVQPTAIEIQRVESHHGYTNISLGRPGISGIVVVLNTRDVQGRSIDILSQLRRDPRTQSDRPATVLSCNLLCSNGNQNTVVRLDAVLYWTSGVSAYPQRAGVGRRHKCPDYIALENIYPDASREFKKTHKWTPQDFYDSLYVPPKTENVDEKYENVLESQLYPFQKRAITWMLNREGVKYNTASLEHRPAMKEDCVSFYERTIDLEGNSCFVNYLEGTIVRNNGESEIVGVSGGLLSEEMGLGKTVEVLALLLLHQRPNVAQSSFTPSDEITPSLRQSKATMIITPSTILQQWKAELALHAPALQVLHYQGISSNQADPEGEENLLVDMTTKYDVILVTYQTLSKEVHYSEDPPDRNMRHARKFERRRSPLVQIQWWRICMDEAQMVESGVSAAARVANCLPRIHGWAVTGTPLRKDVEDLYGILVFLRVKPFCDNNLMWRHLITNLPHLSRRIFGIFALRHTKAQIREDLHLPPQKRMVITMPFSAVEQQHYSTLFAEMCEDVGVTNEGAPNSESWDPEDRSTIEAMRNWLVRLRQTCLHPQVGGRNRRALGRSNGPLRTVAEVLEVMIDQNEGAVRVEERNLLSSRLLRAHILGNNRTDDHRSEKALEIYLEAMKTSSELVREARQRLEAAKRDEKYETSTEGEESDTVNENVAIFGKLRGNLRTALQLQHVCTFFVATAYYQIKSNEALTQPDSEDFKKMEDQETSHYESAKGLRKELLRDSFKKSENWMRKIAQLTQKGNFTKMPKLADLDNNGGIESRRIVDKSDDLFDILRAQAEVVTSWRAKMAEYLLKPLVDVDDGNEITGDEYEDSTKLQDELYAYFDAIKAVQADMETFITGQDAPLIDYEVKSTIHECKKYLDPNVPEELKGQPHAPELSLTLYETRNKFRSRKEAIGSIRGLIQEARSLENTLQGHASVTRAAERQIIHHHLIALQSVFNAHTKALAGLTEEVELFRSTQNQRLEFYRQLQALSDAVQPYKEDLDEDLDHETLKQATEKEQQQSKALAQLKTKNRFLLHLRDESGSQEGPKICVICQCSFESGVLTVCGHQYCRDCITHWWTAHRTCPVCKRRLATVDFHNITYKPQELRGQEENQSVSSSPSDASSSPDRSESIYSDVDSRILSEIKAIDLPSSYGTKIDTLGRHLLYIRAHDPGAKSIVFSQYRQFLDVLGAALTSFKIGFSRLGKQGAADRFKRDPSIDCLLLDAKTDSSGLTLVNATHVFICEPLINTAVELQAIARVHRIGQTRPTTVWMYLIKDTVEEAIYEVSVARRLAHVQSRQSRRTQQSGSSTPAPIQENALDAANTDEMQSAPISKLLVEGKGGGEVVVNDDLWKCLFGKVQRVVSQPSAEVQKAVDRHLRAEAAEQRRFAT